MAFFQKILKGGINKNQPHTDPEDSVTHSSDNPIPAIYVMGKNANEYIPLAKFWTTDEEPNWNFDFLDIEEFLLFVAVTKMQGTVWKKLPKPKNILWVSSHRDIFQKAYDLFEKGQYQDSIDKHLEYLRYNPISKSSRLEIATCYLQMGQPNLAMEVLKTLYPIYSSKDALILRKLGYTLFDLKDFRSSWICYWASLNYDKDNQNAKKDILQLSFILKEPKGAITPELAVNQVPGVMEKYEFTHLKPEQFYTDHGFKSVMSFNI